VKCIVFKSLITINNNWNQRDLACTDPLSNSIQHIMTPEEGHCPQSNGGSSLLDKDSVTCWFFHHAFCSMLHHSGFCIGTFKLTSRRQEKYGPTTHRIAVWETSRILLFKVRDNSSPERCPITYLVDSKQVQAPAKQVQPPAKQP